MERTNHPDNETATIETMLYKEEYRPQFHFSPAKGWMNDPNGLVYYEDEYHLFFQYHPESILWGPMHWGHAVSKDLVHWKELPVALFPDEHGMIFSGSVVIDEYDTTGFFEGGRGLVAVFTHSNTNPQAQSLAYSKDKGRTWEKYIGNPVIPNPGMEDFRDPKVIWHHESGRWIMVLACYDHVKFYSSPNLLQWKLESEFGIMKGSHAGVWECPDLFCLPVFDANNPDTQHTKWVLSVNINSGGFAGGSGNQWFMGTFDGQQFVTDHPSENVRWTDYGADFYASQSFYGTQNKDNRLIWLAWMNNWKYASETPTRSWRSAMSLPRKLFLKIVEDHFYLVQQPVEELSILLPYENMDQICLLDLEPGEPFIKTCVHQRFLMQMVVSCKESASFSMNLRYGKAIHASMTVRFDRKTIQVQRFHSEASKKMP